MADDRLEVTIPANDGIAFVVGGLGNQFSLVGDFEMQVDFSLPTWPAANGVNAGIITPMCTVSRNSHYENGPVPGPVDTYMAYFAPGQVFFWVYTADRSGKMRLKRTGSTVAASFWQNGEWQSFGSHTDPQLGAPIEGYIGAESGGGGYGPTQTVTAVFDNYQIIYDKIIFGDKSSPVGAIMPLLLD